MLTEQQILHFVSRQPKHMAGFKQFVHDLGIKGRDRRHLQQLLRDMTRQRKLIAIGKERWGLPTTASNQDLVVGRLRMHREGYGFVIPDPGSLPPRAQGKLQGDIFIPPPEIGNAMHGDQVLVEMGRIRHDGRAEGKIVRVMEREQETVVGIFHYGDRHNFVTPIDEKVAMEIIIPRGMEYPQREDEDSAPTEEDRDVRPPSYAGFANTRGPQPPSAAKKHSRGAQGSVAQALLPVPDSSHHSHKGNKEGGGSSDHPITGSPDHPTGKAPTPKHPDRESPHRVLGSEARRHIKFDDLENVVVEVEIIQWPSATQNPRGRVTEILGYEDDFGVDVEMIIRKHHIPHVFPADVLEEAQEIAPVIPEKEIARRRDFRSLPIVTIDGETARDFDDAVLVTRLENGNYELQVHIADVAHYVEDGSAIDEEARKRGTSVYFPDRAVPMLPLELSTGICSLRPHEDRLVLSCIMEIDRHGEVLYYELAEGVIRSAQRMTYTDVNAIIEAGPAGSHHSHQGHQDREPSPDHQITRSPDHPMANLRTRYGSLSENFDLMYELAQVLNRKRVKRGSIDFDLPEPVIEFDEHGMMRSVEASERNWAHRLIEEFMLAANETVASHLEQRGIASLYRIHEKPDPKRIYEFETIAASFGYSLGVGALPIKRVQVKGSHHARFSRGGTETRGDKRHYRDSGRRAPTIELPEEVHVTPRMYQKLVSKITGKPEERVLSFLMLRSLKQARYSEVNEGHFALAAPTYTHFTSPIRRYPDLIVHRVLKWALRNGKEAGQHESDVPMSRFSNVPMTPGAPSFFAANEDPQASKSHGPQRVGSKKDRGPSPDHPITGSPDHQIVSDVPIHSAGPRHRASYQDQSASPWSKRAEKGSSARRRASTPVIAGPYSEPELHEIAESSSQSERTADEAERELLEWKKLKFMEQRVGEDFDGLIVSVTKFGFFVELTELFIEGLVPLNSLADDHYTYHENTRQIIGQRSRKTYSIGDRVRVLVDRIDHLQRKIQFAILEEKPTRAQKRHKKRG
jgi:ribonuclease R